MPVTRQQIKASPQQIQKASSNRGKSSLKSSRNTPLNEARKGMPSQISISTKAQKQIKYKALRRFIPRESQQMRYYIHQYPRPGGDYAWQTQESQQSYSSSSGSGDSQSSETSSSDENCSNRRKEDGNRGMKHEDCNETSNSESGSSNTFKRHRDSANSGSDNSDEKTLWSPAKRDLLERTVSNVVQKKLRTNAMLSFDKVSWDQVAAVIPGKNEESCKKMWLDLYHDHVLSKLVNGSIIVMRKIGAVSKVAFSEIKENHNVDPAAEPAVSKRYGMKLPRVHWTDAEKARFARLHRLLGNRWKLIAAKMDTGKTPSQVRQHWARNVSAEQAKEDKKAK